MADEPWHLDKRVPIALIFAILVQTGGAFWFAASLDGRIGVLERDVERGRSVSENHGAAIRTIENNLARMDENTKNILLILGEIKATLSRLEGVRR